MNLEELSRDTELKEKIENAQSLAEVVEIFREKGIEVTEEQLEQALHTEAADEFSEAELQEVAGGRRILWPGFPRIPGIWPPYRPLGWPWRPRRR